MWRFVEADAKKDFDEDKIKRDKDGKFAKKNESGDNDKKGLDNNNNIEYHINKLPEHLKEVGKRVYNDNQKQGEYLTQKLSKLESRIIQYTSLNKKLKDKDIDILFENAMSVDYPVYRGSSISKKDFDKIINSGEITFDKVSGFSSEQKIGEAYLYKNIKRFPNNIHILYHIEGRHKQLNIEGYNIFPEKEKLIKGIYKIISTEEREINNWLGKPVMIIKLKEYEDNNGE